MDNLVWMLPPFAVGLLVLATHASLGRQVLARGIVFIDLAIAQIAAVGVLVSESIGLTPLIGAVLASCFAVVGASLVAGLSRVWPARREALIGLVYVGAAAVTIFWASADPQAARRVSSLLSGDVLWTTWSAMVPLLIASLVYWGLLTWRGESMANDYLFYPCFAVLVSLSVPLLGLYLVFVCLIVPALWFERCGNKLLSGGCVALAFIIGIVLSYWLDWPTGTTVVLVMIASVFPVMLPVFQPVELRAGQEPTAKD